MTGSRVLTVLLLVALVVAETASAAIAIAAKGSSVRGNNPGANSSGATWTIPQDAFGVGGMGDNTGNGIPAGTELLVIATCSVGALPCPDLFTYKASPTATVQNAALVGTYAASGNERISIWYIVNPTPGVYDNINYAGITWTIHVPYDASITSFYRSIGYVALTGVATASQIGSFVGQVNANPTINVGMTAEDVPMNWVFVTAASGRRITTSLAVPTLTALNYIAGGDFDQGRSGSSIATSIASRMDVTTPMDPTTARNLAYTNTGQTIGGFGVAIRPRFTIDASANPEGVGSVSGGGSVNAGASVTVAASVSAGYGFVNWTEESTQVSTNASYAFTATSDRTLVANFGPAYTLTFDAPDGTTPVPESKTVTFGSTYGALATTSRVGYGLAGWWTAPTDGSQVLSTTNVTITSDQTLYARWLLPYTVTFDAQGGTDSDPVSKIVTVGSAYGTLATTLYVGYDFAGWWTAPTGGSKVSSTTTVTSLSAHTLYARWTPEMPIASLVGYVMLLTSLAFAGAFVVRRREEVDETRLDGIEARGRQTRGGTRASWR